MAAELFFVEKRGPGDGLSDYARTMFHGYATRPGAEYPLLQYMLGDELRHPLELTRNTYFAPSIVQPSINCLLPGPAAHAIEGTPNISLLGVKLSKLFRDPYDLVEVPGFVHEIEDSDEIWERYDHQPSLVSDEGPWFELVVPRHQDLPPSFLRGASSFTLPLEWSSAFLTLDISAEMLREYPAFWNHGLFIRSDLLAAISPWLDRRFFAIRWLSL